jgi:hypothetical protein
VHRLLSTVREGWAGIATGARAGQP